MNQNLPTPERLQKIANSILNRHMYRRIILITLGVVSFLTISYLSFQLYTYIKKSRLDSLNQKRSEEVIAKQRMLMTNRQRVGLLLDSCKPSNDVLQETPHVGFKRCLYGLNEFGNLRQPPVDLYDKARTATRLLLQKKQLFKFLPLPALHRALTHGFLAKEKDKRLRVRWLLKLQKAGSTFSKDSHKKWLGLVCNPDIDIRRNIAKVWGAYFQQQMNLTQYHVQLLSKMYGCRHNQISGLLTNIWKRLLLSKTSKLKTLRHKILNQSVEYYRRYQTRQIANQVHSIWSTYFSKNGVLSNQDIQFLLTKLKSGSYNKFMIIRIFLSYFSRKIELSHKNLRFLWTLYRRNISYNVRKRRTYNAVLKIWIAYIQMLQLKERSQFPKEILQRLRSDLTARPEWLRQVHYDRFRLGLEAWKLSLTKKFSVPKRIRTKLMQMLIDNSNSKTREAALLFWKKYIRLGNLLEQNELSKLYKVLENLRSNKHMQNIVYGVLASELLTYQAKRKNNFTKSALKDIRQLVSDLYKEDVLQTYPTLKNWQLYLNVEVEVILSRKMLQLYRLIIKSRSDYQIRSCIQKLLRKTIWKTYLTMTLSKQAFFDQEKTTLHQWLVKGRIPKFMLLPLYKSIVKRKRRYKPLEHSLLKYLLLNINKKKVMNSLYLLKAQAHKNFTLTKHTQSLLLRLLKHSDSTISQQAAITWCTHLKQNAFFPLSFRKVLFKKIISEEESPLHNYNDNYRVTWYCLPQPLRRLSENEQFEAILWSSSRIGAFNLVYLHFQIGAPLSKAAFNYMYDQLNSVWKSSENQTKELFKLYFQSSGKLPPLYTRKIQDEILITKSKELPGLLYLWFAYLKYSKHKPKLLSIKPKVWNYLLQQSSSPVRTLTLQLLQLYLKQKNPLSSSTQKSLFRLYTSSKHKEAVTRLFEILYRSKTSLSIQEKVELLGYIYDPKSSNHPYGMFLLTQFLLVQKTPPKDLSLIWYYSTLETTTKEDSRKYKLFLRVLKLYQNPKFKRWLSLSDHTYNKQGLLPLLLFIKDQNTFKKKHKIQLETPNPDSQKEAEDEYNSPKNGRNISTFEHDVLDLYETYKSGKPWKDLIRKNIYPLIQAIAQTKTPENKNKYLKLLKQYLMTGVSLSTKEKQVTLNALFLNIENVNKYYWSECQIQPYTLDPVERAKRIQGNSKNCWPQIINSPLVIRVRVGEKVNSNVCLAKHKQLIQSKKNSNIQCYLLRQYSNRSHSRVMLLLTSVWLITKNDDFHHIMNNILTDYELKLFRVEVKKRKSKSQSFRRVCSKSDYLAFREDT